LSAIWLPFGFAKLVGTPFPAPLPPLLFVSILLASSQLAAGSSIPACTRAHRSVQAEKRAEQWKRCSRASSGTSCVCVCLCAAQSQQTVSIGARRAQWARLISRSRAGACSLNWGLHLLGAHRRGPIDHHWWLSAALAPHQPIAQSKYEHTAIDL